MQSYSNTLQKVQEKMSKWTKNSTPETEETPQQVAPNQTSIVEQIAELESKIKDLETKAEIGKLEAEVEQEEVEPLKDLEHEQIMAIAGAMGITKDETK